MNPIARNPTEQFVSTREAAARLGVALSTVQAWVETGAIPAWKTAGGHRRIPIDAIEAMRARQQSVLDAEPHTPTFTLLVVEDDPVQQQLYRRQIDEWQLPIRLFTAADGFEGLILAGRLMPDLIISDLAMPEMDGFRMIRSLTSPSVALRSSIMVVTALTAQEINARGGLPLGIPVYPKPIPFAALRPVIEHMFRRLAA